MTNKLSADKFSIGILKGLIEHNDETRYFGSLMAFDSHLIKAMALGFVTEELQVTELGLQFYEENNIQSLPETRAYLWSFDNSDT